MIFLPSILKAIFLFALYKIIDLLVKIITALSTQSTDIFKKYILVIKTDGIGDYVLFRDQLHQYKIIADQHNCTLTLLCSNEVGELAKHLDSNYISKFLLVDKKKFLINILYRIKFLLEVNKYSFQIVISPTYSKDFFINDWLLNFIDSNLKIGRTGDSSNISNFLQSISKDYYDILINDLNIIEFEHYKNAYFTNEIIKKLNTKTRVINNIKAHDSIEYNNSDFCILFIGGSGQYKRWHIDNYLKLSSMIYKKLNIKSVLCGSQFDLKISSPYLIETPTYVVNKIGQLNLIELTELLKRATFTVSNDTGAAHISGFLLQKITFVIYSGLHFTRFLPYPENLNLNCHVVLHPEILRNSEIYKIISNSPGRKTCFNINDISAEDVFNSIVEQLN